MSVGGLILMLDEPALRSQTLKTINDLSTIHWAEIFNNREKIEDIANNTEAPEDHRRLACSICSRCFYYMENYASALSFALRSGEFLAQGSSEYHAKIVSIALDTYVALSQGETSEDVEIYLEDPDLRAKLNAVVDELFKSCVKRGSYKEAIGIAFESRNVEKVKMVLDEAGQEAVALAHYCFNQILSKSFSIGFKVEVIKNLTEFFEKSQETSFTSLFAALHALNDAHGFAELLEKLFSSGNQHEALIAIQAAFDILSIANTSFIKDVSTSLGEGRSLLTQILRQNIGQKAYNAFLNSNCKTDTAIIHKIKDSCNKSVLRNAALTAYGFMQAGTGNNAFLTSRAGHTFVKPSSNWSRFSAAGVYGAVHMGTGDTKRVKDFFPKPDLAMTSKAGPFSDGGGLYSLGLMHAKGGASKHLDYLGTVLTEAVNIRASEPQQDGTSGFKLKTWEPLIHGACLGVGLIGFGRGSQLLTADIQPQDYFTSVENDSPLQIPSERINSLHDKLLEVIKLDEAVASEAAAWALGLLNFGAEAKHLQPNGTLTKESQDRILSTLNVAREDTAHERVIRACSLQIACTLFGAGSTEVIEASANEANTSTVKDILELMQADNDAIIRYGAMFGYGMAFVATSKSSTITNLLQVAVSDVNNDVRRGAVINLGLICIDQPTKVPELLALLAESYNPHVRYGSAIALGIAGTNMTEDVPEFSTLFDILFNLCDDKVDFVRQGAFIGLGMALSQGNWNIKDSYAKKFYDKAKETYANIKTSIMSRFGAIIAIGLLEAGGRNSAIKLYDSKFKVVKPDAVAGLVMFLQYWYWYPLMHLLTLSLTPSALIGITVSDDMKKISVQRDGFEVACDVDNKKLKEFAYPEKIRNKKAEHRVKIQAAVLSMTKQGAKRKADNMMEVEAEEKQVENDDKETRDQSLVTEEERAEMLKGPLRVTKNQEKYITFKTDTPFVPIAPDNMHKTGVVVLLKQGTAMEEAEEEIVLLDMTPKEEAPAPTNVGPAQGQGIIEEQN